MRIGRTLYESLPYAYMLIGAAAVATSFLWQAPIWADMMVAFGLVAIILGLVLVLRRRDYRIQQRHYGAEFDEEE